MPILQLTKVNKCFSSIIKKNYNMNNQIKNNKENIKKKEIFASDDNIKKFKEYFSNKTY